MSHFSLIVALPGDTLNVEEELEKRLEPFNENRSVEPYRDYEYSKAEDFWWYRSIKRDAEVVANQDHSVIRPYNPDLLGFSSAESRDTPEQQWADVERDAAVYNSLPNPVTWETLVAAYNRYYCEGHPYSDGTPMYWEAETDRAYTMSTYNPLSKWDYWRIGGRWPRYFPLKNPESWDVRLIGTPLSWEWRDTYSQTDRDARDALPEGWVEGGPKGLLDFEVKRKAEEDRVRKEYEEFMAFVRGTGWTLEETKGWSEFLEELDRLDDGEDRKGWIDRLREVYRAQPLVAAFKEHRDYRFTWGCLIDKYKKTSLEELVRLARIEAVPGYALLTLEQEWKAPGEMGWFGMSTDNDEDRIAYKEWANEYLDNLPDDTILVVLDLHI